MNSPTETVRAEVLFKAARLVREIGKAVGDELDGSGGNDGDPEASLRPAFVGANGESSDEKDAEMRDVDDPRGEKRPPANPLQGGPFSKRRRQRLLQDLDVLMQELPPELVEHIIRFVLKPRFLPDYTWQPVPVASRERFGGTVTHEWVKTDPDMRRAAVMEEIRNLSRAYATLLHHTQHRAYLTSSRLRAAMYRDWFTQPTSTFWISANRFEPIHGTRFSEKVVDNTFVRTLYQLNPRSTYLLQDWYSRFLADCVVNFDTEQRLYDFWKLALVKERSKASSSDGIYYYDNQRISKDTLNRNLWPLLSYEQTGPMAIYSQRMEDWFYIRLLTIGNLGARLNTARDTGQTSRWQEEGYVKLQDSSNTYRTHSPYVKFVARAMTAFTMLRMPGLSAHIGFLISSFEGSYDLTIGALDGRPLVWNNFLVLGAPPEYRKRQRARFVYQPKIGTINLSGLYVPNRSTITWVASAFLLKHEDARFAIGRVNVTTAPEPDVHINIFILESRPEQAASVISTEFVQALEPISPRQYSPPNAVTIATHRLANGSRVVRLYKIKSNARLAHGLVPFDTRPVGGV